MKLKALLIVGAIVAIAVPTAGAAKGGTTRDSVTGGGQAFFDGREPAGAGDTIAFQAQRAKGAVDDDTTATGQIQVNRRGEANAVKFHGTIDCLVVNGEPKSSAGTAYMSGAARDGTPFELYVTDGGQGPQERMDTIMLFVGPEAGDGEGGNGGSSDDGACGLSEYDGEPPTLARGNVQVRNRNLDEDYNPEEEDQGGAAALSALGL